MYCYTRLANLTFRTLMPLALACKREKAKISAQPKNTIQAMTFIEVSAYIRLLQKASTISY
jgi:hypothetical protein